MADNITALRAHFSKPEITIESGGRPASVRQAADALVQAGVPLYRRGGTLVRTTTAENLAPDGVRRPDSALALAPASPGWLTIRLCEAARWYRFDARAKDYVETDAPQRVAGDLIAVADELPFPPLRAIARHPLVRDDGTIADAPGYDEPTRLLLDFDASRFPAVPDYPSEADAQTAAQTLRDLLRHFPFVGAEDRAVALAAFLTALQRPILPAAPMVAFDAPVPGSGKSLLAHAASILATGDTAPMASVGGTAEETEKRLDAALLAGDPILVLDNIEAPLGGEKLCSLLTEPTVRVRRLGGSDLVSVPSSAAVIATGNNLRIKGDVARRAIVSRLDPGVERPELRAFDQDLLAEVRERRGELVTACLTLVRAYHVAGQPTITETPIGSYAAWDAMVRSPLIFANEADPVSTMERLRVADPTLAALREVLGVIYERFASAQTAKELANAAQGDDNLRDALLPVAGNPNGTVNTRRLGNYLAKHADRIVDGMQLRSIGTRKHAQLWHVCPVTEKEE
jgi:hypothetical protein